MDFNKTSNILTFDIEQWYHANYPGYDYTKHISGPDRLAEMIPRIIDLFLDMESRATFFILGEVAQNNPRIVKTIADAGFPIACHSFEHNLHKTLDRAGIYKQAKLGKEILEDITGYKVRGFRAPCFAIDKRVLDIYSEILPELGYEYDSSLVPLRSYGFPDMPDIPFSIGRLTEFPIAVYKPFGFGMPATGARFRILPEKILHKHLTSRKKLFVAYLHPKDLDEKNPNLATNPFYNFIHKAGTASAFKKFENLLSKFHFVSIEDYLLFSQSTTEFKNKKIGLK